MRQVRHRRGLTLIELVFVVAILAILAGFLVPRLGIIRNLAGAAGNADQTRAAIDQAFLYNIEFGKFPAGEDSLVDTTGAIYSKLDAGLAAVLEPKTLTATEAQSINGQLTFGGSAQAFFFDADNTVPNANDAFVATPVKLAAAGSVLARVRVPSNLTSNHFKIYEGVYGRDKLDATTGAPLDGSWLLALGNGPNTETNGKTAIGAPVLYTKDSNAYGRPIFLVKVYGTTVATYTGSLSGQTFTGVTAGGAAATAGALSPQGFLVSQSLSRYQAEKNR